MKYEFLNHEDYYVPIRYRDYPLKFKRKKNASICYSECTALVSVDDLWHVSVDLTHPKCPIWYFLVIEFPGVINYLQIITDGEYLWYPVEAQDDRMRTCIVGEMNKLGIKDKRKMLNSIRGFLLSV